MLFISKLIKTSLLALILLIVAVFFFSLFYICDFDLWHHLTIGKYVWNNKEIPQKEFLVYPLAGEKIIHSEWLFQILIYFAYAIGKIKAIQIFKTLIILICFIIMYQIAILNKLTEFVWFPLLFFALLLGRYRFYERPELFGYLFLSALLLLIELYEKREDITFMLISVGAVLIWANSHLSFILYFIILGMYLVDNLIIVFLHKEFGKNFNKILSLLIVMLIAFFASLYNPYGISLWSFIFKFRSATYLQSGITEMLPIYKTSFFLYYLIIASISLLSLIMGFVKKNCRPFYLLLFIFVSILPLEAVRFITFFILICTFLCIKNFSLFLDKSGLECIQTMSQLGKLILFWIIAATLILAGWLIGYGQGGPKFGFGIMNNYFPEEAANFILENRIPAPMFNPFDWGHYLAWKLYPHYQVFIDGRVISPLLFYEHDYIMNARTGWNNIVKKYKINFILTNSMYFDSGDLFPLITSLLNLNEWALIYKDEKSLIFIANDEKNKKYIEKFSLDKKVIYDEMISEAYNLLEINPTIKGVYATLGFAYIHKGNLKAAKEAFSLAVKMRPKDPYPKKMLNLLKENYRE